MLQKIPGGVKPQQCAYHVAKLAEAVTLQAQTVTLVAVFGDSRVPGKPVLTCSPAVADLASQSTLVWSLQTDSV